MLTRLHARYHYGLSQAHRSRGNRSGDRAAHGEAIGQLSLVPVLDTALAPAYFARGQVYGREPSDYERAVRDFGESLILNPKHAGAVLNRGPASVYAQLRTPARSGPQAPTTGVCKAGSLVPGEPFADFERGLELGKNGYGRIEAHNQIKHMQGSTS